MNDLRIRGVRLVVCAAFLCLAWACSSTKTSTTQDATDVTEGDSTQSDTTTGDTSDDTTLPAGCDHYLMPSSDDQDALQTVLIQAQEGATVCLAEGTFSLTGELSINKKGLVVKGAGRDKTILDFSGQKTGANGIAILSDGVVLTDLQVLNSVGDGIRATGVDGVTFQNCIVRWSAPQSPNNGAYGLYPVESTKVLIDNCLVEGARDAGIYVGQSNMVLVRNSEATNNVAGIEIENTTDAEVANNHSHGNTGGILVFNLPGLEVKDGKRANVHDNLVEDNNVPNWGKEGTIVAKVPHGIGVMILASDNNEIHDNTIKNNNSIGILFKSYDTTLFDPWTDVDFDPFPQANYVHGNTFENNGTNPHPLIKAFLPGLTPVPDVVWDGCVDANVTNTDNKYTNCVQNGSATYVNYDLCGTQSQDTDLNKVDCSQPSLPTQTFAP